MKKILIVAPPFSGHLNALKGLMAEYHHEFEFHILITGWTNLPPDLTDVTVPARIMALYELHDTDPLHFTLPRAAGLVAQCEANVRKIEPDLIIYDFFSLEAHVVSKKLGIPAWCSISAFIGPYLHKEVMLANLEEERNAAALRILGLRKEDLEMVSDGLLATGELNIIWSYPAVTPANYMENRKPSRYVFGGYLACKPIEKKADRPTTENALVYFSLGTIVMNTLWNSDPELRERLKLLVGLLAEQWRDKPFRVLFAHQGKTVLSEYPPNWCSVAQVDQKKTLSEASLFITHAGANSLHEAIANKVPMLAVPFFGDQLLAADRIAELGIGKNVAPGRDISTTRSTDFINEVLAERIDVGVRQMLDKRDYYAKNFEGLATGAENICRLISDSLR